MSQEWDGAWFVWALQAPVRTSPFSLCDGSPRRTLSRRGMAWGEMGLTMEQRLWASGAEEGSPVRMSHLGKR